VITSDKKLKIQLIVVYFQCETIVVNSIFLLHIFYRNRMQKKLLLLIMAAHCAIHASDSHLHNEQHYADYTAAQAALYQSALINALSDNDKAIDEEDEKNAQEIKEEEESNKKKQYDGIPGYWATEPTAQSKTGRKFQHYAQHKENKNRINKDISKKAHENKDKFSKEILPEFRARLEDDRFFINNYCVAALRECREDVTCYDTKGLSSTIFTNPDFGAMRQALVYTCFAKFASERNVDVSVEELQMIAEHNKITQEYFNGIQDGIKNISLVRDEILNPKKQEEDTV